MRLPQNIPIGAGRSRVESIQTTFSTADEVTQLLVETMGYYPLQPPQYPCPVLDVSMLTTDDWKAYSLNWSMFKAWWDFYNEKLAEVSNQVLQCKNTLTMIETATKKAQRELASATHEKITEARLKEQVLENPEYQAALLELQRYQQAKELVEAKFESLDKSLAMLSRQIEIRRIDLEQTRTGSNIPNRGHYSGR